MVQNKIRRYLQWYDKNSEVVVGDESLKNISLSVLQTIFNVQKENPMYESWEVKAEHLIKLQKYVNHTISLNKYSYFVETYEK